MQHRPTTHAAAHGRGGFTIAEVLVVVVIMSGILVSITQVLSAARDTRDTIHNMNETQLAGPAILDMIEADLRGLFTYSMRPAKVLRVTQNDLSGEPADRIDFVTTTNSKLFQLGQTRVIRSDFNEVGYMLRENPDRSDFLELYRREGFVADEEPFTEGEYTFLHDRVKFFDITVYDEEGPDAEPLDEWNTEAEPENRLPLRIEIEMKIEMAPRLLDPTRAASELAGQLEVTYKRSFRLDEPLLLSYEIEPVARIPEVRRPNDDGGTDLADDGLGTGFGDIRQGITASGDGTISVGGFGDAFGAGAGDSPEGTSIGDVQEIIDIFSGGGGGGG